MSGSLKAAVSIFISVFLVFAFLSCRAPSCYAEEDEELSEPELHYLVGQYAFLKKDYGVCADQTYQALSLGGELGNRARLYLASCQFSLNLRSLAAYHLKKVDMSELRVSERAMAHRLERQLRSEMEAKEKVHFAFYPYSGLLSFSAGSPKISGTFFGMYSDISSESWKLTLGGENLAFSMASPLASYSQDMGVVGVSLAFSEAGEWHGRMIYIYSNLASQSGVMAFQSGVSFNLFSLTRFHLDGFFSLYPHSSLGSMTVAQASVSLDQGLFSGPEFELSFNIGSHTELPSSPSTFDSLSKFSLSQSYKRISLGLNSRIGSFGLGGGLWSGKEAFGIRDDGAVIFSALEEHQGGWTVNTSYRFSDNVQITLKYSVEHYVVGPLSLTSGSAYGMLSLWF